MDLFYFFFFFFKKKKKIVPDVIDIISYSSGGVYVRKGSVRGLEVERGMLRCIWVGLGLGSGKFRWPLRLWE